MNGSDRPLRLEGFQVQELDGELILYHPEQSRALCLNAAASLIWGLCDGETTVSEMTGLLGEAFPDAPDIEGDVRDALQQFSQHASIRMA